jgi:choline-phosphate cytidylyltransferase
MESSIRIYADGVFDIPHYGHFQLFKSIKQLYPNCILIIGVSGDEECKLYKRETIFTQQERVVTLEFCKYIDIILSDIPWIITSEFVDKHSIDYICHNGDPYPCGGISDIYKPWKDKGMLIHIPRTETISTTNIIERINNISKTQHQK